MNTQKTTLKIAYIGLMSALLSGGKLAMLGLPNIEPVTVLLIVFATSFGWQMALISALVFCTVEMLLYGFGSWVISYYIYWSILAVVSGVVLKRKPKLWIAVLIAIVGTIFFGVVDAFVYACFVKVSGNSIGFFRVLYIYYIRGLYFVLLHLVSSFVLVGVLFKPLTKLLDKIAIESFN